MTTPPDRASWEAGPAGKVIGVDLNPSMCLKAQAHASAGGTSMECHEGRMEDIPLPDESADVVISNGVINLCPDKNVAFAEAWRVLRSGGVLQFADIANTNDVPEGARREIDLWTG